MRSWLFANQSYERVQLRNWIRENMPELSFELGRMSWDEVRIRLNQVTGLTLEPHESIDDGALKYLEALKAKVK